MPDREEDMGEVLPGGCPQYFVMRYEARVSKDGVRWQECSQVGSAKLIHDRVIEYAAQPDDYRGFRLFVMNEVEVDVIPMEGN